MAAALAVGGALTPIPTAAADFEVLYAFQGFDGRAPFGGLVLGGDGALYGTTYAGGWGGGGCGTVFKLTPPVPPETNWTHKRLHSFKGANDCGSPRAGLIFDGDGALYGTTEHGGRGGLGAVFKLTPPVAPETKWAYTRLYSFKDNRKDGSYPWSSLVLNGDGALYGTTKYGGTANLGTVFRLTPPVPPETEWIEEELYHFRGYDGALPSGNLILDGSGALYGTTTSGGPLGCGTVFKLMPPVPPKAKWALDVLYYFSTVGRGCSPAAGLIFDNEGALYGTASAGGRENCGTVFKLTQPVPPETEWTLGVLYHFKGIAEHDGCSPAAGLIFDGDGALYGTTYAGGKGYGTVFRLTPPVPPETKWTETVLHRLNGAPNGAYPVSTLIFGGDGALYGTASGGAAYRTSGTVFKVTPR